MKTSIPAVLTLFTLLLIEISSGANILFFYGASTLSHRTCVEPLAHKLVERGHNVTFLSPLKPEKENSKFTEFCPIGVEQLYKRMLTGVGDRGFPERLADKYVNHVTEPDRIVNFNKIAVEALLSSPDFQPWMEKSHFDLIFLGHAANKFAYPLAYKYNASVIVMSSNTFYLSEEDMMGIPLESSWLRRFGLKNVFTEMNFYDRIYNVLHPLYLHFYALWITYPEIDKMIQNFFGNETIPPLEELEREHTSLFFINQHFSEDFARSLPPMVVPVGGMHCTDEHKPLPKDMEEFIEGAGDAGFIFVSFGSMVKMSKVPDQMIDVFFNAIKNLKTRFIWRWDSKPPAHLPKNVYTQKWLPQQDLLAHPRIKGFISHGGLMSIQQAIFHAVPLIVLPVCFDQPFNAFSAEHHGIGIHLELSELTESTFQDAVIRLVEDKSIKEKAKIVSRRFRDRPMSPVDSAVYWTEYAIRHKDLSHMKSLGVYQSWWKRRHLDVWAIVMTMVVTTAFVFIRLLTTFVKTILTFTTNSPKKLKVN